MDVERKKSWAKAILVVHEQVYGKAIGARLKRFWDTSEGWKYEGTTLQAKLPGFSDQRWRVNVAPPSWNALAAAVLDDAVVGPNGDWTHAGSFLPVFSVSSESGDGFIVASVADPSWVGFFHEEHWESSAKGFRDGVFVLAQSLDQFLFNLGASPQYSLARWLPGK
jgi:hypothetical protein